MTGALSFSTTSLIVPANKKLYFIFNNTTGGFAVTVKVSGQTGVLVPNGKKVILTSNGTDIVEAANQVVGAFGVGGTATMAAINASGTVAMAGAATVRTTLAVAGILSANNNNGGIQLSSSGGSGMHIYGGAGTHQWDIYLNSTNLRIGDNTGGGSVVIDTAATIGSTLGVTGTSTMGVINAGGKLTVSSTSVTQNTRLITTGTAGFNALTFEDANPSITDFGVVGATTTANKWFLGFG